MLSFDFSAFDLVLSIGVIVLIALFVTTLVKLNPSGENKEKKNVNAHEEEQELTTPTQDFSQLDRANLSQTFPQSAERTTSEKLPSQVVVGAATGGSSQESFEQAPKAFGYREQSKNHKAEVQKPAPKDFEEKDCFHSFGYLAGLPKNTPIPGECFGCQRIVDCLITPKKKR